MNEYYKFTSGFVTQKFVRTESGWQLESQNFEAGESDYESPFGTPIDPPADEVYEPFDMVQPLPKDEAIEELKRVAAKLQEAYNDDCNTG